MSILVTGGAGYIGSHTTHQLVKAGYPLVVLDDLSTGHAWTIPKQANFVQGNVGDRALVAKVIREHKIKSVIHFAGFIRVEESVSNPLKYYENNTVNSHHLISVCANEGVRQLVFSSTAAVYGFPKVLPVTEESPVDPMNPYGLSKLMTEWVLRDFAASFSPSLPSSERFRYIALRYFNVAGAQIEGNLGQMTQNATHLIKVACETVCGLRKEVPIFGTDYPTEDGTCIRDYIHVDDLARAHVNAVQYLDAGGDSQVMNCGYGHGFSVREVLRTLREISGVDFSIVERPRRAGDSPAIVANASKIRKVLDWKPQHDDLRLICETALKWEQKLREKRSFS